MKKVSVARSDIDKMFTYAHKWSEHPQFVEFDLHTHIDYEVFIFIKGDVTFVVEGIKRKLSPYDLVLIRGNELHQSFPNPNVEYERIVINIADEFFDKWHCEYLRDVFSGSTASRFIPGEKLRIGEVSEDIKRIEKNIRETKKTNDTVVKCSLIQLLHDFGSISYEADSENTVVAEIIKYINQNITGRIQLDDLAERFFLSKYYMCRIFKKTTGFTVNQYIVMKRILLVKQLYKKGINLSTASIEAGFGDYVNFYKAYTKEFGISPKKGMKNK